MRIISASAHGMGIYFGVCSFPVQHEDTLAPPDDLKLESDQ